MDELGGQINKAAVGPKKPSPTFTLGGSPVAAGKSGLPIGELRALGKDVQAAHPLRGALRLIGDEWVLGIKFPSRVTAIRHRAFLCFRWDGQFGSAITLTTSTSSGKWIARGWIWSRHPAVAALRASHALTVVSVYNSEPISVIRVQAVGESSQHGIEFASDNSNEDGRRPGKLLIELDENLAYWDTFEQSSTWDPLLRATDHLQVGWLREFWLGLTYAVHGIRAGLVIPELTDADRHRWDEGGLACPQEFWDQVIFPLAEVLRGKSSILEFIRTHHASDIFMVIADVGENQRIRNPLHDFRWEISTLAECALLADTHTDFGRRVVFSTLDTRRATPVEIPTAQLSIEDARKYWENLPGLAALNVGDLVTASMQPADLTSIIDQIKAIRLGCDRKEADIAIATMTEEANILNRWTIPWGARVQVRIGPFTEVDFYSYGDEISILLKTADKHYRWAAFNIRTAAWNFNHLLANRFQTFGQDGKDAQLADEITAAFQLILVSIVRDFVVLEERESAFAVRRDTTSRGRVMDDDSPRIVYIPRIRYVQSPDTKSLENGLEYESRRPHHVRAHQRRADAASPYQRILAERYGFRLEPGYTFVRPHQRGGITPEREVIYRSRSAMQSLYGVEASIESNGTSNWFRFERDVHDAMAHAGFKVDHVASARNGDAGVDVFAENSLGTEFWAIQCKCYAPKRKVGPAAIRELIGALAGYPPGTRGMMVTTSGYSSGAIELAKESNVELRLLESSVGDHQHHTLIEVVQ